MDAPLKFWPYVFRLRQTEVEFALLQHGTDIQIFVSQVFGEVISPHSIGDF